ncbi:MAG: PilZ domain-containing protein [Nitrosomonas sp.]|nr:PilZ domain-containing protein [Nitrosomonas sp.]
MNEQRTNERFNLCCLVTFREGRGLSRDISTTGIYFSTKKVLKESEMIQLTIHLNQEPNVQCDGKVVRTEQRTDGYGVAVQFTELFIGV